ncbi:hypothetical protein GQ457_03G020660 [Hibiscus cannabinus]
MKDLLFVKALHLPVFATQKLDSKSDEELEFEKQQVCGFIQQFVEENVYNRIDQEIQDRTLWEKIESLERNREKDGKGRDKSRSESKSRYKNLECHHCGKKGHIKKYCFNLKRHNKGVGDKHDQNDEEKFERAVVTREDLLVICDENLVNLASDESSWVIDTGASIHVTLRRDCFTSYTPGKLDDKGFCNTFNDGQWKLTKGSLVVARGKKSSNLYLMQASTFRDTLNVTVNDSSTELWHKQLSHMSEKGLNFLAKKNQLSGLNNATLKNCAHCLVRKQRRVSVSSRPPHRKSELLELVHSDVCGSIKVYTLKSKDQVFDTFKQFQASVERETGKKLKCIRTDNGGEYSGPFHEYCLGQGNKHQRTPPKTPQMKDPSWMPRLVNASLLVMVLMTIDEIDNTKKEDSPYSGDLIDVNSVPLDPSPNPVRDDVHSDVNDDQHDICDFDAPGEHECYEEAMESEYRDQWVEAMNDELQSLHDNYTFE